MVAVLRAWNAGWLSLGLLAWGTGCGSEPPAASADDVVFPNWTEPQGPRQPIESRKLQESDKASHAGIEADPDDAEHKARKERARKANESTLLPDSADSKFFGGCGAIGGKCTKEPPH